MLVQLVQLCSMFFGILFGLSALVSIVQLCSIPLCYGWYAYIKYGHVSFSSVCMNDFIRLCQSCFTSINNISAFIWNNVILEICFTVNTEHRRQQRQLINKNMQ